MCSRQSGNRYKLDLGETTAAMTVIKLPSSGCLVAPKAAKPFCIKSQQLQASRLQVTYSEEKFDMCREWTRARVIRSLTLRNPHETDNIR